MEQFEGLVRFDRPMLGEENMAIDNELLSQLTPSSPIFLRLYRWLNPTLSLGHFQTTDAIDPSSPVASPDRVHRKTGGGAILHHHEWTYSLVLPNRPELGLKGHSEEIYRAVHNSIVNGLRDLGWDAALSEECTCALSANNGKIEPFLCFMRRSPVDVVIGKYKIMGSAQRRGKTGLLQHGSFLLRRSEHADNLLGVLDLSRNENRNPGFTSNNTDRESSGQEASSHSEINNSLPETQSDLQPQQVTFPLPSGNSPLSRMNPSDFEDGDAGIWLAERIISGLGEIFHCRWKLI